MSDEADAQIEMILEGMTDYMESVREEGDDPGYKAGDIKALGKILRSFVEKASEAEDSDTVKALVKAVVLKLNDLNEKCNSSLIETDQREEIVALINEVAADAGYESDDPDNEDITEEWREW